MLIICSAGLARRWSDARRLDGAESFKAAGRIDYYEFGRSLREVGVLGWSGWASAFRGPVYPAFLSAVEPYRADVRPRAPALDALTGVMETAVSAAAALQLFSPAAGLAAAAMTAFHPAMSAPLPGCRIEPMFGLLLCLVMWTLILWCRGPTWGSTLLLAFSIGVSLMCRAVLFAFPIVLVCAVLAGLRHPPGRGKLWAILLVPYLVLGPWILRNAIQFGRFIPFDDHAATRNMFAASVGYVENDSGPYQDVLAIESDPQGALAADPEEHMLALAWRNIKTSPGAYAVSCARRLLFIFRLHPWLLLLALAGAVKRREDPAARALSLLCLYYILAHIPMTLEPRYMEPLLPLLAVLGAGLVSGLPDFSFSRAGSERWGRAALGAALFCLAALYGLSVERLAAEVLLTRVPCRLPRTPLTDYHCGAQLLSRGERDQALARQRRALAALPGDPGASGLLRAKIEGALILAGDAGALLATGGGCPGSAALRHPLEVQGVALQLQDGGRPAEALRLYDAILACRPDDVLSLSDRAVARTLAGREDLALKDLRRALELAPGDARASYNLGILLERRGRRKDALAVYTRARDSFRDADGASSAKRPLTFFALISARVRELSSAGASSGQRAATFRKTAANGGSWSFTDH